MDPIEHIGEAELFALLEWYQAAGADAALAEKPINHFTPKRAGVPAAQAAPAPEAEPVPPGLADPALAEALAQGAQTLDALRKALLGFEGCGLKRRATQLVFSDGNPDARVMLIGEAPGAEEDRVGKPFVGRAGQLLDRMLKAVGLDRTQVYVANTVPWRPPGNRDPSPLEIASCLPFLFRQIELVAPKVVVTLGNVPTKTLFSTSTGITRMRGQWKVLRLGGHETEALAALHPAYLLRLPSAKQHAWLDMLSLKAKMESLGL